MASYLTSFNERIRGFPGTKEQVEEITKAYKIYYERVPTEDGGGYTINHTASVFLMGKDGRFVGILGYGEDPIRYSPGCNGLQPMCEACSQ